MAKVGFFGAGKMAEGILSAIEDKSSVLMAEKNDIRAADMEKRLGVAMTPDVKEVAKKAKMIFLAVRPQDVDAVAAEVKPLLKPTQLLVSIVAGKTLAKLRKAFGPKVRLIRVMPNLGVRVYCGACAIAPDKSAKTADVNAVGTLLSKVGIVVRLPEKNFDAVTALSGSGPAYFAYMLKAMVDGGVRLGLQRKEAFNLAMMTMAGTGMYLIANSCEIDTFIAGVCTKGGTTAAGMEVMESGDFQKIVAETLAAAARRSKELA